MSTSEEIQSVYRADIAKMTAQVLQKKGPGGLLEGASGMHVESLYGKPHGDGNRVRDFKTRREDE